MTELEPVADEISRAMCRLAQHLAYTATKDVSQHHRDVKTVTCALSSAQSAIAERDARIAELEAMLKDERERGDRIAGDWFTFCEDMEVTPDTQEAVAYELKADFSNLRARAESAEEMLKEAGKVLEPFAAVEVNELYDDCDEVSWPFFYAHQLRAARSLASKIGGGE